jgi:rare lipoprotein A
MRTRAAALLAAVLVSGCAHRYHFPPPVTPRIGFVERGIASWYGPGYHGNRTSNGEVYDQEALTAAHERFAFGTRVKVTLLATQRSVVVRINDRFPNHKGRVIDLSRAAARAIGLIGPGTGQVRIEVVS